VLREQQPVVLAPCDNSPAAAHLTCRRQQFVQLSLHLASINSAPQHILANPDAAVAWGQEVFCRAYSLQVLARSEHHSTACLNLLPLQRLPGQLCLQECCQNECSPVCLGNCASRSAVTLSALLSAGATVPPGVLPEQVLSCLAD
jgi:hypothetical protein